MRNDIVKLLWCAKIYVGAQRYALRFYDGHTSYIYKLIKEPVRSWDNNQQSHYYGSQQGGWGGGPAGGMPPMGAGSGYPPQSMNPTNIGNGSHNGGSSQPPSVLEALITHPQYPMHPVGFFLP